MIDRIKIENMKGFVSYRLELSPRTFLTGWNGSGKSSVLDAIEMLLLGSNRYTTATGQGASSLKRIAGQQMRIEGIVIGKDNRPWTVKYTLDEGPRGKHEIVGADTGELLDGLDALWGELGYSRESALVSMRAQRMMEGESFSSAFSLEFPESVTPERLRDYLVQNNKGGAPEFENYIGWYKQIMGTSPDKLVNDIQWRVFGDAAFTDRTATKKRIAELKTLQAAFTPSAFDQDGNEIEVDQLGLAQSQLVELERKLEGIQRLIADHRVLQKLMEGIEGECSAESIALNQSRIQELLANINNTTESRTRLSATRTQFVAQKASVLESERKARAELDALDKLMNRLQADIIRINEHSKCATCNQELSSETKKAMIEGVAAEIRRVAIERPPMEQRLDDITNEINRLDAEIRDADFEISACTESIAELTSSKDRLSSSAKAVAQVESLTSKLTGVGDIDELVQEEKSIMGRIQKGKATVDNLNAKKGFMARAIELKTLESRVKQMTDIIDTFGRLREGPGAFQAWVVVMAANRFCERANPLLSGVGYRLGLRVVAGELCIYISGRQTESDIRQASNGERFMAAAAVAIAFGASGGLALMDNADCLDGNVRSDILHGIAADSNCTQIVVAGHWRNPGNRPDMQVVNTQAAPFSVVWMGV